VNGFVIRIDAGLGDDVIVEPIAAERRGGEEGPALVITQTLAKLTVPRICFDARGFVDPQAVQARGDEVQRIVGGFELDQDVTLEPERVVGAVVVLDRRARKDLIHIAQRLAQERFGRRDHPVVETRTPGPAVAGDLIALAGEVVARNPAPKFDRRA
jgi:hypothetical protein